MGGAWRSLSRQHEAKTMGSVSQRAQEGPSNRGPGGACGVTGVRVGAQCGWSQANHKGSLTSVLPIQKLQSHRVLILSHLTLHPVARELVSALGELHKAAPLPLGGRAGLLFHVPRSPACLEASFQTSRALVRGKGDD